MKTLNTHVNYTIWEAPYQLSLPLNISFQIPDDDPVRLVKLLIERMDLSPLYHTYSRIEKNQASPRQLLAIVIYASMNQIFSSRRIVVAPAVTVIGFVLMIFGILKNSKNKEVAE